MRVRSSGRHGVDSCILYEHAPAIVPTTPTVIRVFGNVAHKLHFLIFFSFLFLGILRDEEFVFVDLVLEELRLILMLVSS
jgi:hypothetical protein